MRTCSHFASIASCAAAAAVLAAGCSTTRTVALTGPAPAKAATVAAAPAAAPVASVEYGRVSNIEFFQPGTASSGINVPGAIVGGVAGAAAGSALSGGRDAATVLGGAAGAAIGSQVGKSQTPIGTNPVYRVTIQTDAGAWRTYDVPATGDLRIGDRVRVDNGVIYRS
jgi:outer membrane lipoprotein SlyB